MDGRIAVIIEDEADIRHLLEQVLQQGGFETHSAANGVDGVELVRLHQPVVTTLDLSLPGIDGFETARRIRALSDTYLVILTALSDEIDTLMGLEAGADDYMTKPFRPRELRARIEAMLRRPMRAGTPAAAIAAQPTEPITPLTADAAGFTGPMPTLAADAWLTHRGLRLEPDRHLVVLDGTPLELTRSEFVLLQTLMESRGRVLPKGELALALRDEPYANAYVSDADKRAVEVHLANLRRKLGEDAARPRWIETVRGVGYRLTSDA